jgi:hypothetical protein
MNTLPSVKYPRSFVPGKVPDPEHLPFGWIAINHFDGDVFVKRSRSGIGTDIVKVGSGATTTNLIWVTKDGKDTNSGKNRNRTIRHEPGIVFKTIYRPSVLFSTYFEYPKCFV